MEAAWDYFSARMSGTAQKAVHAGLLVLALRAATACGRSVLSSLRWRCDRMVTRTSGPRPLGGNGLWPFRPILPALRFGRMVTRTSGPRPPGGNSLWPFRPILPALRFGRMVTRTLHGRKVVRHNDEGRPTAAFWRVVSDLLHLILEALDSDLWSSPFGRQRPAVVPSYPPCAWASVGWWLGSRVLALRAATACGRSVLSSLRLRFGRMVTRTLHGRKVVRHNDEGRLAAAFCRSYPTSYI